MKLKTIFACIAMLVICVGISLGCGQERGKFSERQRGEHNADLGGEGHGEEDGTQLKLSDTYDVTKNGVQLLLKWDAESMSFKGVVKNVSDKELDQVRVEVHYTRRFEIGPTKPGVLKPGESREVTLQAETDKIVSWNTHAEIGNEEHGDGNSEHGIGEGREHRGEGGDREHGDGAEHRDKRGG